MTRSPRAAVGGGEVPPPETEQTWLDEGHHRIDPANLNDLRVRVMAHLADHPRVHRWLLALAQPYLEDLMGNELAVRLRPNLSAQLPGDLWERLEDVDAPTTADLFAAVEDVVRWVTVSFGEVLLFDQSLPHGNRANLESTTQWSINCRFTGVFTPYADKGLGDFFTPAQLRPVTMRALGLDPGTRW